MLHVAQRDVFVKNIFAINKTYFKNDINLYKQ